MAGPRPERQFFADELIAKILHYGSSQREARCDGLGLARWRRPDHRGPVEKLQYDL